MILTSLFQGSKARTAAAVRELQQLCYRLLSEAGTANSAAIAEQVVHAYSALPVESRLVVQPGLSHPAAGRLELACGAARENHSARSSARRERLERPEAPIAIRPALFRVLPSAAAGRAADLRRSRPRQCHSTLDRAAD